MEEIRSRRPGVTCCGEVPEERGGWQREQHAMVVVEEVEAVEKRWFQQPDGEINVVWNWGEPLPSYDIVDRYVCGWRLDGRAVPLLDPNPCMEKDGTRASEELGYCLTTGTTQTTRLQTGVYRMYFGSANLLNYSSENLYRYRFPVLDSSGNIKFGIDIGGNVFNDYGSQQAAFWGASGTDPVVLHFSKEFVGYIDSVDGINYPMYAPFMNPASGLFNKCGASYAGVVGILEDSQSGFWAGWRSTSIRATNGSVAYRDVSVVYFAPMNCYVMFAIEGDGRGLSVQSAGEDVVDGAIVSVVSSSGDAINVVSSIFIPTNSPTSSEWVVIDDNVKTRFVFFTCPDPNFGTSNTMGPFPVSPEPPDYKAGQWIGVPQAFLSPDGRYLFYFIPGEDYEYDGLHVALIENLVPALLQLQQGWQAGRNVDKLGNLFYKNVIRLGHLALFCNTPTSGTIPTPTDEHFVFCPDGRLNLYMANRNENNFSAPLRVLSRAGALESLNINFLNILFSAASSMKAINDMSECFDLIGSHSFWHPECPIFVVDGLKNMLLKFRMEECDPVFLPNLLNADTVQDGESCLQNVEMNDPNVYQASDGRYVMVLHSAAVGGLLRFVASETIACTHRESC